MWTRVALSLATAVAAVGVWGSVAHADTAMMRLSPASQNVADNANTVTVDLLLDGATDVAAWEAGIKYNAETLEFVSIAEGPLLKSAGKGTTCLRSEQSDLGADVILYGCGTPGATAGGGVDGSGVLATLTFRPKARGTADLLFVKRELSGPLGAGDSRAVDSADAVIKVIAPDARGEQLAPTAQPDPQRLVRTRTPEPDPFIRAGNAQGDTPGGSSGSAGSTGEVRGTSGAGVSGVSGTSGNRNSVAGGPVAGTGAGQSEGGRVWWPYELVLFVVGAVLTATGLSWVSNRRTERRK